MKREKKQKETRFKTLSKYFLDLSKLVFGGIVLAGVMDLEINIVAVLIAGVVVMVALANAGFIFLSLTTRKKK